MGDPAAPVGNPALAADSATNGGVAGEARKGNAADVFAPLALLPVQYPLVRDQPLPVPPLLPPEESRHGDRLDAPHGRGPVTHRLSASDPDSVIA